MQKTRLSAVSATPFFAVVATASIAALVAALPAAAQSSVTMYGFADASARHVRSLGATNQPGSANLSLLSSGINRTTRWGFRGSEDLGSGLRATFNLEAGINLDVGSQADALKFWDRAAVLGLQGSFGALTLGRQTTLLADTLGTIDPLGLRFAGFNPNVQFAALSQHSLAQEFGSTGSTTGSYRLDNSAKLVGEFGPVQLKAMFGLGEATGSDRRSTGLGAGVRSGGFAAQAAFMRLNGSAGRQLDAWMLGGGWRAEWGGLRLSLAQSEGDTSATAKTEYRTIGLGASFKLGPALELLVGHYDLRRERTAVVSDGFGRTIAFLEYALSRRTTLYLEADHTRWRNGYQAATAKASGTGLSSGIVHSF